MGSLVQFLGNDSSDSGKIKAILDDLQVIKTELGIPLSRRNLLSSTASAVQFAGCDGQDQDHDEIIDNCEEDRCK